MKTGHTHKVKRVVCIAALPVLLACTGMLPSAADAFRQVQPPARLPHPVPPPQAVEDTGFRTWSSMDIITELKDNGLEAVIKKGLTVGPPAARETTLFLIPSAGENIGGLVAAYRREKALEDDLEYYMGMNKPGAPPAWRIFRRENILLLISGKVPEETALEYKKVLNEM